MKLNIESKESILELINYLDQQNTIELENSEIAHFESKDYDTNKIVLLTLYKNPSPVKLSINVQGNFENDKFYALFDNYGERIENIVEGEY
ncbi:hypothetical protein ACN0TX_12040 [Staphylococcus cohnii]|uniref:hypothetical protein n=1 Tax=Staphylococcus cohnii TaxID=29382 RepID=UPI003AF41E70